MDLPGKSQFCDCRLAATGTSRYNHGDAMPQTTLLVFRAASGTVPLLEWLDGLESSAPKAYARCLARILLLEQFGFELRRPSADILRDGIWELRAKLGTVHNRILYFFCGK